MPRLLPVSLSGPRAVASFSAPEFAALAESRQTAAGVIEIELEAARIRVCGAVDEAALRTVLDVLLKR